MDDEKEMIRKVGEWIFGKLANELSPAEFDVLLDLWRKYRDDMNRERAA